MSKEGFLKDYKLPDYYFDTVYNCSLIDCLFENKFVSGGDKTIFCSRITVYPSVEGGRFPLDSHHLTPSSPPSEQGDIKGDKHYALWEDPFKKALVSFCFGSPTIGEQR
ncbi:hypothetical protein Vadar_012225 [Vaccinium darrowii]|uniref:Uncharacterized protein n=1 Tax=Vaccinium darrowii TaxID=229202 RepID=A0ACB7XYW6_9ERIC|nr:hypothetical protein Vadar_012225 [Vaccinium darrowii]